MGLRFRKSINLGGGFRINVSKSGIGYSWGTKGYRVTRKANGGKRKTYSIPGTGISWVEDSKKRKRKTNNKKTSVKESQIQYDEAEQNILYRAEDTNTKMLVTENSKEFIETIKKYLMIKEILRWFSIIMFFLMFKEPLLLLVFIICLVGFIYFVNTKKIYVEYECDDYGKRRIQMLNQAMETLLKNKMIWQIVKESQITSNKKNAGAVGSVNRSPIKIKKKKPDFMRTDATCYSVKMRNDMIYILPDRLVVRGRKGWGVVEYSELHILFGEQPFVEYGVVPKDTKVIGKTWQYVNKDGGPDKRYNNNRQLPKCVYGYISFKSDTGLDIIIYVSDIDKAMQFKKIILQIIEESEEMKKNEVTKS